MKRHITLIQGAHLFAATFLVTLFHQSPTQGQSFRAAHVSDGFISFEYALINNDGVVVFSALRRDSAAKVFRGVYKSRGGQIRTVAESPAFEPTPPGQITVSGGGAIWINNRSVMALYGFYEGFTRVFVGSGAIGAGQEAGALISSGLLPTITDNNYLAFGAVVQPFPYNPNSTLQPCTTCVGQGRLNNQRRYLRVASTNIHIVTIGTVTHAGDNRTFLEPIRTNRVAGVSEQARIAGPKVMLNDNGRVAFFDLPSAGVAGIYKDPAVPVVEQRSGSEFTFNGSPPFALNNQERVAFLAHSSTFGKPGFFRGSSPFADKIVLEGDFVAGAQVTSLAIPESRADRWHNDRGQIVFRASDNNGTGLWVTGGVASPPSTNATTEILWNPPVSPATGDFGTPGNWQPLNGDPPRVPEKTVIRSDVAIFDRAEVYSVTIGNRYNERVLVKNGNVSFIDGAYKVDALSFADPSLVVDNARLTLGTGMTMTNNHALIGQLAASRVDVGFFGKWITLGSLRVGGAGEGILNVNSGGWVKSAESRIGTGAGGGRVVVTDTGKWTNGSLAIGMGGAGELIITNGGFVESDFTSVGAQIGSSGRVNVLNATASSRTMWKTLAAAVGDKSSGQLRVTNGALAEVEFYLNVGATSFGIGTVSVSGVDAQNRPATLTIADSLYAGVKGQANVTIENGGQVMVQNAVAVGTETTGSGRIVVGGTHSASGIYSRLSIDNELVIGTTPDLQGFKGRGMVEIQDGGSVEVEECYILCGITGRKSEIVVKGADSQLIATNLLIVGYTGNLGDAVLTLDGGYVECPDVTVNHNGKIVGNGTLATIIRTVNDNGTISPGLSPGVLTLQGNYEQGTNGRLLIEIGGTNASDYDQFIVTSNATLNGNFTLRFLDGFAPRAGDSFPFLNVGGAVTGEFSSVGLQNLAPGFQFQVTTNAGQIGITALNNGVFSSALPGQVQVVITNVGGFTYAAYTIITTSTCESIALDGPFVRSNNVFSQAFQGTTFIQAGCAAETKIVTGTLILGALSPGDYSFRIMSNRQLVETVSFTVPPGSPKTLLNPTRLADGSLQFQIDGLSPIEYTIEASENLIDWIPLDSGTLPSTYVDPDAAILPQRYYRALIAP